VLDSPSMEALRFCINDRWFEVKDLAPTTTLLRFLREHAGLGGTKEGCAEGDCGACTVAVVEQTPAGPRFRGVNSCLLLLPMIQGKRLYTVEGLKTSGQHHVVQTVMAEKLGSQCGYCTPGVVMSLFEGCYRDDLDEPWKIDAQMCGNLCRCTGYRPIRDAAKAVGGLKPDDRFLRASSEKPESMALSYATDKQRFFTPERLEALWPWLEQNPGARAVIGGTDLSLEVTKRYAEPPVLFSLEAIPQLRELAETERGFSIGAAVTLTDLEDWTRERLPPVERMLRYFGARQIKNRGTVGGNLCNASPIGDLPPVLIALGAEVVLASREGERRLPLDQFFLSYRKTALGPGEILARVEVPRPHANDRVCAYKVSKRRELDISAVASAFAVRLEGNKVASARLAYGGMAATPKRASLAEAALLGQPWTAESVERAVEELVRDFTPLSDHRGSAAYRLKVAQNLLRGFLDESATAPMPRLPHPHTATVQTR
jgi:xanthine dehydrogenase small subunit